MREPICIVSADWHLSLGAWRGRPDLWGDAYYGLSQVVDLAIEHEVPVLALGDLFDIKTPDAYTVKEACRQIDRLNVHRLQLYYIQGQHELSRLSPWLAVHPWPTYVHRKEFSCDNITMYGLDWLPSGRIQEELNKVPQAAQVLLSHQVWREVWNNSPLVPGECSFEEVPDNITFHCSGDYHKHYARSYNLNSRTPMFFVSPGSLCLQSVNESTSKAVFILYDDLTVSSEPIKSREVKNIKIEGARQLTEVLADVSSIARAQPDVPTNIATPIVAIKYDQTVPDIYCKLTEAFRNKAHIFHDPYKPVSNDAKISKEERQSRVDNGLIGTLDLLVPPKDPVNHAVRRLLESGDPYAELDLMESEFLAAFKKNSKNEASYNKTI